MSLPPPPSSESSKAPPISSSFPSPPTRVVFPENALASMKFRPGSPPKLADSIPDRTSEPRPIRLVSVSRKSASPASASRSSPSPPSNVSAPNPPVSESSPASPFTTSSPVPPLSESEPSPPNSVSSPSPPSSVSAPTPPFSESSPSPPLNVSAPPDPSMVSFPPLPSISSAKSALPVILSGPLPPTTRIVTPEALSKAVSITPLKSITFPGMPATTRIEVTSLVATTGTFAAGAPFSSTATKPGFVVESPTAMLSPASETTLNWPATNCVVTVSSVRSSRVSKTRLAHARGRRRFGAQRRVLTDCSHEVSCIVALPSSENTGWGSLNRIEDR